MQTRYANKDDLPEVYVMYLEGLKELGNRAFPVSEKKALEHVLLCWSKAPCILLTHEDKIVGFAGLTTCIPPYSEEAHLRDYMFFTKPSHRGIRSWRVLTKAVQEVSDRFKMPFIGELAVHGKIDHHKRLVRMAGAKPVSVLSIYGGKNE